MNNKEACALLDISENFSPEDLKKAYRKKAMEFHPDRNQGNKEAEDKFKKIAEAYEYLSNPNKNKSHRQEFEGSAEDIMSAFFRSAAASAKFEQSRPKPRPGLAPVTFSHSDVGQFPVSIEQAIFREEITLKVNVKAACESCLSNPKIWTSCTNCSQSGIILKNVTTPYGSISRSTPCKRCNGRGWLRKTRCSTCSGNLVYFKKKEVKFKLPENFKVGQRIRLAGKGNENWNTRNSDIYLTPKIEVPNLSNLEEDKKKALLELLKK